MKEDANGNDFGHYTYDKYFLWCEREGRGDEVFGGRGGIGEDEFVTDKTESVGY